MHASTVDGAAAAAQTMTRATSSSEVSPERTFSSASWRRVRIPWVRASRAMSVGAGPCHDGPADLLGHGHDLVEGEAAEVARLDAARSSRRDGRGWARPSPSSAMPDALEMVGVGLVGLTALPAQPPAEALGEHAVDRAGHEEGVDAHLGQAGQRRRVRRWCGAW